MTKKRMTPIIGVKSIEWRLDLNNGELYVMRDLNGSFIGIVYEYGVKDEGGFFNPKSSPWFVPC